MACFFSCECKPPIPNLYFPPQYSTALSSAAGIKTDPFSLTSKVQPLTFSSISLNSTLSNCTQAGTLYLKGSTIDSRLFAITFLVFKYFLIIASAI